MAIATNIVDYYLITMYARNADDGKGRWGFFDIRIYADNKRNAKKQAKEYYPKCKIVNVLTMMVYTD